jgi:hypothetical protein
MKDKLFERWSVDGYRLNQGVILAPCRQAAQVSSVRSDRVLRETALNPKDIRSE